MGRPDSHKTTLSDVGYQEASAVSRLAAHLLRRGRDAEPPLAFEDAIFDGGETAAERAFVAFELSDALVVALV